jgi:hypothetical protein
MISKKLRLPVWLPSVNPLHLRNRLAHSSQTITYWRVLIGLPGAFCSITIPQKVTEMEQFETDDWSVRSVFTQAILTS